MHEKVKMLKNCQIMQKNAIFAEKRDFAKKTRKTEKNEKKRENAIAFFEGA